jgi:CheY-like chemotaxis protein
MPDKDGIQTAREIRKLVGDDVPIIILSAFDYSSIEQEAREAGINAFIAKPLFRSRLVYVMKSLMLEKPEETSDMDILHSKDYSGKRVLLVEDNEINMEIAVELLGQTGISVDTAENGQVALTRVTQTPPGYYDLIFMDIQMPVMNGYEATAAIRASGREDLKTIPIVAMSADVFMDDVKHAQDSGMNGHVGKPVKIEALVNTLENWIS